MSTKTFDELSNNQQRIMEDAWDAYNHSWHGDIMPIGEHALAVLDSDYEKLADMRLLHRVLLKAGFRHNEYGYEITPAGVQMMADTKYVKRRKHRAELLNQYVEGTITEAELLDEIENGDA